MKKNIFFAAIMAASFSLNSCGNLGTGLGSTSGNSDATSSVADAGSAILNSLLGSILSTTLTEKSIVGTWTYRQPEVRFESENVLAKAGGEVTAANIEKKLDGYLTKVGITKGVTSFTFKEDKTFTIMSGNKTISSGTYKFDTSAKTLTMQGNIGLMNQTCTVGMDGTNLCLLYDADKLLNLMNTAGSILGNANATIGSITNILGQNYKGMKIGFQLAK